MTRVDTISEVINTGRCPGRSPVQKIQDAQLQASVNQYLAQESL